MNRLDRPLTRKVIFEKTTNRFLYIYTLVNTDKRIKNPFIGIGRQKEEGLFVAEENNLEGIEYNESWMQYRNHRQPIIGLCMLNLLKLVTENRCKYIYVRNERMLSRNKKLLNYILHLFNVNGVVLFTKEGRYPVESLITTPELLNEVELLAETVNDLIGKPFEYVKN